ncbi:hypothetical protein [Caulobacter sp. LARHSG274]
MRPTHGEELIRHIAQGPFMLLPSAREKTTKARVVLGIVFCFLFPSWVIGIAFGGSAGIVLGPLLGLFLGWPFVGVACGLWALLHGAALHHKACAATVGVAAGLAVRQIMFQADLARPPLIGFVVLGVATGLGAWWIAYCRQDSVPEPVVTRPPLSL